MHKSIDFYALLGYDEVVFDKSGVFEDWSNIEGGTSQFRRVLLTQKNPSGGGFSKLAIMALQTPKHVLIFLR